MTFTNRELRAKLREIFVDNTVQDSEYVHAEMFVNSLLSEKNLNHKPIQRDINRRPLGFNSGGNKWN